MAANRAYRVFEGGKFGIGRFAEIAAGGLDSGDVVVRSLYASVNYKDALTALGRAKIVNRFPCTVGIDVCGEVTESGDPRFKPSDIVVAHGFGIGADHDGGYQYVNRFPADWLVKVPAGLTPFETAAIGVAGYTAALSVDLMELNGLDPRKGKVLVNGATGGAASVAIDLLAGRGYEVVALSGKPEAADYLRSLGAAEIIDRHKHEFGTRPLEKPQWQGAVDSVGGEQLGWLARSMQIDGVIAAFGNAGGIDFKGSVLPFILRGVRLIGVYGNSPMPLRQRIWQRIATDLKPRHLQRIARKIPFDDLPRAFDDLIEAKAVGRMVVDFSVG
ncbi:MAG: acryloyl-CoA reductase [Betaproteobacteria bacterium]